MRRRRNCVKFTCVLTHHLLVLLQVNPEPVDGGNCSAAVGVEAGGYGALLALDSADVTPALQAFLAEMAAMTATALASYDVTPLLLQQNMTSWGTTPVASHPPPGMVAVNGSGAWMFAVNGTEIEGGGIPGTDVSGL